ELTPHVHDGSARAGNSPHTWTYSFLRSARAGNLLRTRTVGVRVPTTRPTLARTLFCEAHTRGTTSARARWERGCRELTPHSRVLSFVERTCGELPPHVHDGSARAGNSSRTRTYSFQ